MLTEASAFEPRFPLKLFDSLNEAHDLLTLESIIV